MPTLTPDSSDRRRLGFASRDEHANWWRVFANATQALSPDDERCLRAGDDGARE